MGRKPGLPTLYLPVGSTVYWCRFTVNGERRRVSTGTRDAREAGAEAQRFYAQAALGRSPAARGRVSRATSASPLKMLVAEYIVWTRANGKAESYVIKQEMHFRAHFLPLWGRLDKITTTSIEGYKVQRKTEGAKLPTVYKELVTLSRFLKWCKKNGHLHETPDFERFKPVSDYEPPNLTPEDVRRVLDLLPDQATHHNRHPVREFFTVQWAQAMRPGEVMTLTWADVDLDKRRITVRQSLDKARTGRTIGMAKEAHEVLSRMAKLPHLQAARIFDRRDYRVSLELAAERAKLPRLTPHHLRHARLSELASTTRDVGAVQFMAGHKNLSTTDRYVRSRTERTEEMLKLLDTGKESAPTVPESKNRKAARR